MPNLNFINQQPPSAWSGAQPEPALVPVALPLPKAMAVLGLSRSAIYREAGRGNIKLLKMGRSTLVHMPSGFAFIGSLPVADIRAPREGR